MDFIRKYLPGKAERYLKGIEFPITKQELLSRLEANRAPGVMVKQLRERLPERQFSDVKDVLNALRP